MPDKNIGLLPAASQIDADSLYVMEQQGTAMKVTGKQMADYQVAVAKEYAVEAGRSAASAVAAEAGATGAAKAASDAVIQAKTSETKAKEYADAAKEYANETAGNVPAVTVGWDADGYFSWFNNEEEA